MCSFVFLVFVSTLILASDGSTDSVTVQLEVSSSPFPNLKVLLKEPFTEILRETPSLLQPPVETQHGELTAHYHWHGTNTDIGNRVQ